MSSKPFEVELEPDSVLRKALLLSAVAALMIGVALLMRLPAEMPIRLALSCLYLTAGVRELGRFSRGFARVRAIRLALGEAMIVDRRGRRVPVRIMPGSVVLPGLAWLRLECPDGLVYAELLSGRIGCSRQWRRLQVLWRQGSGSFGGTQ